MINRKMIFLGKDNDNNNPALEDYLSEENIPSLKEVISQLREKQKKINLFRQQNPERYKKIEEAAQTLGLSINEEDKIVLCRINLETDGGDEKWHDYFLIEDSIGYDKATHLVKMSRFKLDKDYQVKVAFWFNEVMLPNLYKNAKVLEIEWKEEILIPLEESKASWRSNSNFSFVHERFGKLNICEPEEEPIASPISEINRFLEIKREIEEKKVQPSEVDSHSQEINFLPQLSVIAGLYEAYSMITKLNDLNVDKRIMLLALFYGINASQNTQINLNFISRELVKLFIDKDFQKFCQHVFLKKEIMDSLHPSVASHLLSSISVLSCLLTPSPIVGSALIALPPCIIGSKKIVKECKEIYHNPNAFFSPSKDEGRAIESFGKTTIRRLGSLSSALLTAIVIYVSTENPLLALLALVSNLVFQANNDALDDYNKNRTLRNR